MSIKKKSKVIVTGAAGFIGSHLCTTLVDQGYDVHAIDNLSNVSTNQSASRSQIMDADYAKASTELARSQILQQAGTAILAQANASQQVVLQLLNG